MKNAGSYSWPTSRPGNPHRGCLKFVFADPCMLCDLAGVQPHPSHRYCTYWPPGKHGAFTQCCFNVGPASKTVAQHWNSIGWMSRVCWATVRFADPDYYSDNSPTPSTEAIYEYYFDCCGCQPFIYPSISSYFHCRNSHHNSHFTEWKLPRYQVW